MAIRSYLFPQKQPQRFASAYRIYRDDIFLHGILLLLFFISAVLLHGLTAGKVDGPPGHLHFSPTYRGLPHLHALKVCGPS